MFNSYSDRLDFTSDSLDSLNAVLHSPKLNSPNAASFILRALLEHFRPTPFGEYLSRYVAQRARLSEEVPKEEIADLIRNAFQENGVPASFDGGTIRLRAFVQNCLSRTTVERKTVFLLGFGLQMTTEDVEEFLLRSLHERQINFKDPFEVLCWYCFEYRYGYGKYLQLTERYEALDPAPYPSLDEESTGDLRLYAVRSIRDENALMRFLSRLKTKDGRSLYSVSMAREFALLYREAQKTSFSLKLNETQNTGMTIRSPDDITPSDLEHHIYASVPKDRHGNLAPERKSALHDLLSGYRLSRQRLHQLNRSLCPVMRSDLLTLYFYSYGYRVTDDVQLLPNDRLYLFNEGINGILRKCGLGEIYTPNPYEALLQMCAATRRPDETFADLMELAYEE